MHTVYYNSILTNTRATDCIQRDKNMFRAANIHSLVSIITHNKETLFIDRSKTLCKLIAIVGRMIMLGYILIFISVNGQC